MKKYWQVRIRSASLLRNLVPCLLLLASACVPEKIDLAAPFVELSLAETNPAQLHSGDSIGLILHFSDDVALSDYGIALQLPTPLIAPAIWDTLVEKKIWGQTVELQLQLPLAEQAVSGNYKISAYCHDSADRVSDTSSVWLHVLNAADSQVPQIDLQLPALNETVHLFGGGNLVIYGDVSDEVALYAVVLKLSNAAGLVVYQSIANQMNGANSYLLEEVVAMPQTAGNYTLIIEAIDLANNRTMHNIAVQIH